MENILGILIAIVIIVILIVVAWCFVEISYKITYIYHKNIEKQYPEIINKYFYFKNIYEEYHQIATIPIWDIERKIDKKRDLIPRATIQEKEDLSAEIEKLKKEKFEIENRYKNLAEKETQALTELRKTIDNIPNKKHQKYFHKYGYYQRFF